jgi:peptidoglycan hydrolase-like protein with peptidoglycan-binding domain
MRLKTSSILIIICLTCLGYNPVSARAIAHKPADANLKLASATSKDATEQSIIKPGSKGEGVKYLQTKLKQLGYYDGEIDGLYGSDTSISIYRFQLKNGLIADGVFGVTSRHILEQMLKKQQLSSNINFISNERVTQKIQQPDIAWWLLVSVGVLGIIGALMYITKWYGKVKKVPYPQLSASKALNHSKAIHSLEKLNSATASSNQEQATSAPLTKVLQAETTPHLAKINIVDELIKDLDSPDPTQRRKAIWDLGQKGDSRAIQPLVELMINADSQQRSLILAALAEIGTRTLKPMNHALAISLQDESPQVRQNAIRDLTRVYDSMAQISQMLSHAAYDPDAQVQATAKYALSQMNRLHTSTVQEAKQEREKQPEEQNSHSEK